LDSSADAKPAYADGLVIVAPGDVLRGVHRLYLGAGGELESLLALGRLLQRLVENVLLPFFLALAGHTYTPFGIVNEITKMSLSYSEQRCQSESTLW